MEQSMTQSNKTPFYIDVPVCINIWIRPESQRRQFEVIRKARPSTIFLQSDGGRNEEEWEAIFSNRKMYENEVDWDCKIYKVFEDHNNGLFSMAEKMYKYIWERVDRCSFLEDDQIPSVSYFQYCADLLEKYKDDFRIYCICGMNHLEKSENITSDYFFSRQGSIWGIATWKRCYSICENAFAYKNDNYIKKLLKQRTKHNKLFQNRLNVYSNNKYCDGHIAGLEFYTEFAMYAQNQLQIIPKVNLISNVGATSDSAHAGSLERLPKSVRKLFNMPTYELSFPLKHAQYVIPDVEYEKKRNRLLAYNHPVINFFRKIERALLILRYDGFSTLKKKIQKNSKVEF